MGFIIKTLVLIVIVIALVWYLRQSGTNTQPESTSSVPISPPGASSASASTTSTPSAQNAIDLGNNTMAPWGVNATFNGYFPNARWIWAVANANEKTLADGTKYAFTSTFTVATAGTATVHVIADNSGTLILNGTTIATNFGGGWGNVPNYPRFSVPLAAGTNTLVIHVTNLGPGENPAGLLAGVIHSDTGAILTQTNSSWTVRTV